MVNLSEKPYYLNEDQIEWVENIINSMSIEEKIGQLFIHMAASPEKEANKQACNKIHMGGIRYISRSAEQVFEQINFLQEKSKIPLIVASNVEAGGNGACSGGTEVGQQIKISATGDSNYAYELGRIGGIEAAAVGCNMAFTPIVDIALNWRNPSISSRTFSNDANIVLEMSKACHKGLRDSGLVCAAKHFPGDGVDERDQHYSFSVNSLSIEKWEDTFGKVYRGMIEEGIHAIMTGHIMMPAYQKHFNPEISDKELLPATLSKELLQGLLRKELGFNGLIISDASHMVGLTGIVEREKLLPSAIAVGCDMFLFLNDIEEDFNFMVKGYKEGVITDERLNDALKRIIGLKAVLGLHNIKKGETKSKNNLSLIGCKEHIKIAEEISDKAITLVKSDSTSPIPLDPNIHKRILLVYVGDKDNAFVEKFIGKDDKPELDMILKSELESYGFDVYLYQSKTAMMLKEGKSVYDGKESIKSFKESVDVVITFANVNPFGKTTQRLSWTTFKGGWEIPWYVHDMPTIFVSFYSPYHLADVPQIKTYINCYDAQVHTIKALVKKLVGISPFLGKSPVDAFCGMVDTKI